MEFQVQDKVIIDKGADNEDEGMILMLGETTASIYNRDGERYVVTLDRLTKI